MKSATLNGPWAYFEQRNRYQSQKIQELENKVKNLLIIYQSNYLFILFP